MMNKATKKILLIGSGSIAVPVFERLNDLFNVLAFVTKNDKPQGRGMLMGSTPVAILGASLGIKVFKPEHIKEIKTELSMLNFDLMITFSYGEIIPQEILNLGTMPPLNIHGSLLPNYRGAAPIQRAILNEEKFFGISLMQMVRKMDAGPVYFSANLPLTKTINFTTAEIELGELAKQMVPIWLEKIISEEIIPIPQDEKLVTFAPKISSHEMELHHFMTKQVVQNRIRALSEKPGAFFFRPDGKRIKVFASTETPNKQGYIFNCKDGVIYLTDYQIEGKKRQKIAFNGN